MPLIPENLPRFFNTTGPVVAEDHYCLDPLDRIDLEEILLLIQQKKYFALHAPRQSGKTSCLLALADYLNQTGAYACLYINVEGGQPSRTNATEAMRAVLAELALACQDVLDDPLIKNEWEGSLNKYGPGTVLRYILKLLSRHSPKPIVLLVDEIDALVGDSLLMFLRQLRVGYPHRSHSFPQSVVLCGLRDVRDYRLTQSSEQGERAEISAFNIKAESLRLGNFSQKEIKNLYEQHTTDTGQVFEDAVLDTVWELTEGQPWLVNALAFQACFKFKSGRDRTKSITLQAIEEAKEAIILRRETHLDQLVHKLKEPRVYRVISSILAGEELENDLMGADTDDDVDYTRDLGLIADERKLRIANAIYKEVIPRELVYNVQTKMSLNEEPSWYVNEDGRLAMNRLLDNFQEFFREHSQHWIERLDYKESGPQLLLQAFLQRVVNGGGRIEREYGLGRRRTDLLIIWPIVAKEEGAHQMEEKSGKQASGGQQTKEGRSKLVNAIGQVEHDYSNKDSSHIQKVVIELKIIRKGLKETISKGLEQTTDYMDICGTDEGFLIVFDRAAKKSWSKKLFKRQETYADKTIGIWGM